MKGDMQEIIPAPARSANFFPQVMYRLNLLNFGKPGVIFSPSMAMFRRCSVSVNRLEGDAIACAANSLYSRLPQHFAV